MKKRWLQGLAFTFSAALLLVLSLYRGEIPPADPSAYDSVSENHP